MARKEFELNDDQLKRILDASKSVPAMFLSGGEPMFGTPQENANRAWQSVGEELGFDYITVEPVTGKSGRFFTAEETVAAKSVKKSPDFGRLEFLPESDRLYPAVCHERGKHFGSPMAVTLGENTADREAYARLFATAPDLSAFAEQIARLTLHGEADSEGDIYEQRPDDAIACLQSLITKARTLAAKATGAA